MIKRDSKNVCGEYAFRIVFRITILVFLLTSGASAATQNINVVACGNLDVDGGNYVLNQNISSAGTCLSILANNITLDGAYYTINYSQSEVGYGINNTGGYDNITIKNLVITQGNSTLELAHPIIASGMDNSTITNSTIITLGGSAGYGIYFSSSSNSNTISNNSITVPGWWDYGIYIISSSTNIILSNTITTPNYGIFLKSSSNSNNISNNNLISSGGYSVYIESSSANIFSNNSITSSEGSSIYLDSSSANIFSNNTLSASIVAITLVSSSTNNLSSNIITTSNDEDSTIGIYLESSDTNSFSSNSITTSGAGSLGFRLEYSDTNTFSSNTITTSSSSFGIYLYSSNDNTIYNNYFNSTNNAWDDGNNYWNTTKQLGTNIIGGPYLGGNYWSDYAGNDTDGDRLGNTLIPYNKNIHYGGDYLPLTHKGMTQDVEAGGSATTDVEGDGTTASDPVETNVTSPSAGTISIEVMATTQTPPPGFQFLGWQVNIAAPTASISAPLTIVFRINSSQIPPGENNDTIKIYKNGIFEVLNCNATSPNISPDPCVSSRAALANGDIEITVLTSTASTWNFGIIDKTPPTITINTPLPYGLYKVGMALNFSAADLLSGVATISGNLTNTTGDSIKVYSGFIPPPGVYTLVVNATDRVGNAATSDPVFFVVYDPEGGFATGGGWFNPDSESTLPGGRVNFGFVANYRNGKATGNLEFQYKDAGINLKSTTIDWLVLSGGSAEFQGNGTINGSGLYTFRIMARDNGELGGGVDHFDIRIWEGTNTEANPFHKAKNVLAGGNIIVHNK